MASREFSGGCSEDKGVKFAPFPAHTKAFDLQAGVSTVKKENTRKIGLFSNPPPKGAKAKFKNNRSQRTSRALL